MWPDNLTKSNSQPPVSILTPTYNRSKFLLGCIECIKAQTYPKERMEWVVLDDGPEPIWNILAPYEKELNIQYVRKESKMSIGAKRNLLHELARGTILVNIDDDDYYSCDRVKHAVHRLLSSKLQIAGSSRNVLYYTDDKSIWEVGPYGNYHATFGTMAYTKKYAVEHPCNETVAYAEEIEFTKKYTEPLIQLDPLKVMVVICHNANTFSKDKLRHEISPNVKKTSLKLKSFISDKKLRDFYVNC
jgi:glycosyltransferase involved in cell wall biosynthesis